MLFVVLEPQLFGLKVEMKQVQGNSASRLDFDTRIGISGILCLSLTQIRKKKGFNSALQNITIVAFILLETPETSVRRSREMLLHSA